VGAITATLDPKTPVEIWFQDEMRLGQKNPRTRRWARRGTRPRALADLRTKSAYLFGAICPKRGPFDRLRRGSRGHAARRHASDAASP
jgi:hypothetical protein